MERHIKKINNILKNIRRSRINKNSINEEKYISNFMESYKNLLIDIKRAKLNKNNYLNELDNYKKHFEEFNNNIEYGQSQFIIYEENDNKIIDEKVLQRNLEIKKIEHDITIIKEIMNDINNIVTNDEKKINELEKNIQEAKSNIEIGNDNITEASNTKKIALTVIGTITAIAIGIVTILHK